MRKPEDHLISHKDAELLLKLALGLRQAAGDSHEGAAENTFGGEWTHEGLQVRCKAERDRFGIVEDGPLGGHSGDELGAPDSAGCTGEGEFVGKTCRHVHDVSHEG